ncbi:MAG: GrpB family protein [Myxococcales bacterium]
MLDEAITIVPYDPRWPDMADAEIERLRGELDPLVVAYEHFGSTSVPGCDAKPIIDVLVGSESWPVPVELRLGLVGLGYDDFAEAGVPGRLYFRARRPATFDVNLAVALFGGVLWQTNLRVRNRLRRDPALVARYVREKREALSSGADTLLAYSAQKSAFMQELVRLSTYDEL